ncbi:MAG TPA: peptidoglycan -binding protein [Geminicoccus sp.]|uniref:peptidoglycan -binding protein n=1 Tax=Geminicoccus sp. TaxID=2024832 RepID=UPI002CC29E63|nr:peptidoglycan -binding protein [Geminicoccus sp.]HWL69832.1 peptidoglycan -binding protein [Geminicoccus sp.]
MARSRRERGEPDDIWPGFVDALSTLLMGITFLLVVFVLGQFFMSRLLAGRTEQMDRLQTQVQDMASRLQLSEDEAAELRRNLRRLDGTLQNLTAERDELQGRLRTSEETASSLNDRLASVLAQTATLTRNLEDSQATLEQQVRTRAELEQALAEARRQVTVDRQTVEAQVGQLAELQQQIAALQAQRDQLQAEKGEVSTSRDEALAQVALLNRQINELGTQLAQLGEALEVKQQEIDRQASSIEDLGRKLNLALADKVVELSQYRSDFFGRLRGILGERPGVQVVGDRFVFQSEVLFDSGSATLKPAGEERLAEFARTLQGLIAEIPDDLPWILRVDGHTDKRPISTPAFPSNWELSTARAINVARFLVENGLPPGRVAAAGFAEFRPLDPADTEEAYQRNRRIELQLTNF